MEKQITLPSGATVTLKDPKLLKVKDRRKVMLAADTSKGESVAALALGDTLLAIMIEAWSFDFMLPSISIESLWELDPADYDFLVEATSESQKALFPNLSKTVESEADPKAVTANFND